MPGSDHGPSILNPHIYEALRRKGMSKEQAAAISNAMDHYKDRRAFSGSRSELPLEVKNMPQAAKAIFMAAFNVAKKEDPDEMAALFALNTVKKFYKMEGEEWVEKGEDEDENGEYEAGDDEDDGKAPWEREEGEEGEGDEEGGKKGSRERVPLKRLQQKEKGGGEEEKKSGGRREVVKKSKTTETYESSSGEEGEAKDHISIIDIMTLDGSKFRMTQDGYLVAEPRVARTGIQLYKGSEVGRPDMEVVRVMRPDMEVFAKDALSSLAFKPVTLSHPDEEVNSKNWRKYAVGHLSGDVARDGEFIRVPMVLMDQAAIDAYKSGTAQLSVGYSATLLWGDGETADGQKFDAMQTDIKANHVAMVDLARGGPDLKIGDASNYKHRDPSTWQYSRLTGGAPSHHEVGRRMKSEGMTVEQVKDLAKKRRMSTGQRLELFGGYNATHDGGPGSGPHSGSGGGPTKHKTKEEAEKAKGEHQQVVQVLGEKGTHYELHPKQRGGFAHGRRQVAMARGRDGESNRGEAPGKERNMLTRTLTIDGVSIELEDKDGQILQRHLETLDKKTKDAGTDVEALKAQIAELQAQLKEAMKTGDTKDGEIVALKKQLADAAITPDKLDAYVKDRLEIVERATRVLGDAVKPEGKTDTQIKRDTVSSLMGPDATKQLSDDAITGAFYALTRIGDKQDGLRRTADAFSQPTRDSGGAGDQERAYVERNKALSDAWRTKTPAH